ncbi:sensor histidine kinase [Streptomyces sp. WAC05374]|nr:sensor histidine kinase [Streptomyces sp. WAC05374]TDF38953.1 sensor histidine kinase [Streptomyces sp. WAC05374]TDF46848.1 sensor histidine kinase [Streptomyces sp. WAC05374]TDF48863.1 sensor histidine kinase [Streptomyces sp. WAC05374]
MTMPFVVPRDPALPPATWTAYGLTALTVLPLVWRRRAPVGVLLAILATSALYELAVNGPGQPLPYAGLVIVYTIAALSPPRTRVAVAAMLPVIITGSVWLNTRSARELLFALFVFGAAYALGRLTDTRQRYAAARERARIAREMHDILSHAVSLMVVQAEAGPVAVRTAPERAEAAFDAISETGREAMAQLRGMLGVLREDTGAAPPRAPQPDTGELPALLERVRRSGLDVSYEVTGAARALPPALGATVYRVVQEALTNTVKHAAARAATVRLAYGEDEVEVTVTDDGRGSRGVGGGHGLTGVRERAAAHGGRAVCGPGPDGRGFRVAVSLPLGGGVRA